MANYLVTGAAGFIGSRVVELLLDSGHRVVGVDNLNDAYDVRMKDYRLRRLIDRDGFSFNRTDISQRQEVESLFSQYYQPQTRLSLDAVINLAARAGVRQAVLNPWVYQETNTIGTLNLLEACRTWQVPKFILASTSSVYGENAPLPTPEEANSDHPLQPYAASKKGAELLCHTYHYLYGIDVTVFRYFTVFGPAGRPDMVMFRFVHWISEEQPVLVNGDGRQSRGFTYVDDVARGTLLGLKPVGYEVINLGGHEQVQINDLIRMLEDKIGKKAKIEYLPRHPADMSTNWANTEKAGRLLGWKPEVTFDQGVANTVKWYQDERHWARQVRTDS